MNNEIYLNSVNVTESMNNDLVDIMNNVGKDITLHATILAGTEKVP